MKHIPNRALIVVGAALALGIGGGIAVADIPSSTDGTITACMLKPGGTIRLINAEGGATCKKSETKVEWSQSGVPGQDGADGVSGYEIVTADESPGTDPNAFDSETAFCPAGKVVTGGGVQEISNGSPIITNSMVVRNSAPSPDGTYWTATWNLSTNPFTDGVRVFAICVNAN